MKEIDKRSLYLLLELTKCGRLFYLDTDFGELMLEELMLERAYGISDYNFKCQNCNKKICRMDWSIFNSRWTSGVDIFHLLCFPFSFTIIKTAIIKTEYGDSNNTSEPEFEFIGTHVI